MSLILRYASSKKLGCLQSDTILNHSLSLNNSFEQFIIQVLLSWGLNLGKTEEDKMDTQSEKYHKGWGIIFLCSPKHWASRILREKS